MDIRKYFAPVSSSKPKSTTAAADDDEQQKEKKKDEQSTKKKRTLRIEEDDDDDDFVTAPKNSTQAPVKKAKKEDPPKDAKDPKAFFGSMGSKKFSRSEKALTTVKPKKKAKTSDQTDDQDLFDELDDFDVDAVPMDIVEAESSSSAQQTLEKVEEKQSQKKSPEKTSSLKKPKSPPELVEDSKSEKVLDSKSPAKKTPKKLKAEEKKKETVSESSRSLTADVSKTKLSPPKKSPSTTAAKNAEKTEALPESEKPAKKNWFAMKAQRGGPTAPGSKPLPVGAPGCLQNLTFVFTGELDSTSREDAVDLVKRYGARVTSAPSGKTDYVVLGRDAGASKLEKIEKLKLKTLDEDALFELILSRSKNMPSEPQKTLPRSTSVPSSSSSSAAYANAVGNNGKLPVRSATIPAPKEKEPSSDTKKLGAATELWTVKHAPQKSSEIIGNKTNCENLARWLKDWHTFRVNGFKGSGRKDDVSGFRAALISGPPGIGKTTAAHIVAREQGYEALELNASDARNKASLDEYLKTLIGNHSMLEYFKVDRGPDASKPLVKRHCVIMDECDGMGGGDRGGMAELIQLIKKSKIPIICVCNDRANPKVRSLANHCLDLRFIRPSAAQVRSRIMSIAFKEGIRVEANAVDQLVQATQSDIRQVLNLLQSWNVNQTSMNYDQSKQLSDQSKKHFAMGPFDLAGRLFAGSVFRSMSMNEKLEIYFNDYQLLPLFAQENYIRMRPFAKDQDQGQPPKKVEANMLDYFSQAADSISYGDLVDRMIYGEQEFSLMPVHSFFSCVMPASCVQGNMSERLQFPSSLGQMSKTSKGWRLLKDIQIHMRLHISGDKNQVRQSYMPALIPRLTKPLIKDGQDGIPPVIETMDYYFLNKEDWDALLELGMGGMQGDAIMKQIPTNVKSAFTRTYNKLSHPTPFSRSSLIGSKKSGGERKAAVDFEEAIEEEVEEDIEEEQASDGEDKMIKQKAAPKSKKGASSTAAKPKAKGKVFVDLMASILVSSPRMLVTLVTAPTHELATSIARHLVSNDLVACVNILPRVTSVYKWDNKVNQDDEVLMVIKHAESVSEDVAKQVRSLHSYDNPEIISLPVEAGSRLYVDWVLEAATRLEANKRVE